MAWLETCRIDAGKQIKHLKGQGLSIRQAIKKLSLESGIPENTINNWIYERTVSKRYDVFDFLLETLRNEYAVEGWSENKLDRLFKDGKCRVLWLMLWLGLEDEHVRNWYRAAFRKYGKNAKITDMFRTGKIWCNCPNCKGHVKKVGDPHKSMNPDLFVPKGYVKNNAV